MTHITKLLGTATLAAKTLGWAASAREAAATLRTRTTAVFAPDPARVEALSARNARLEQIRKHILKTYP